MPDLIIDEPVYEPSSGWICAVYASESGKTVAQTHHFATRDAALEAARCLRSKVMAKREQERAAALLDLGK